MSRSMPAADLDDHEREILALTGELAYARSDKDKAYAERDRLVAALSKVFPAHLARHDEPDWEDGWCNIVCVHLPAGQATWHIADGELPLFAHLEPGPNHWDGHSTEEKYARLEQLGQKRGIRYRVPVADPLLAQRDTWQSVIGFRLVSVDGPWLAHPDVTICTFEDDNADADLEGKLVEPFLTRHADGSVTITSREVIPG